MATDPVEDLLPPKGKDKGMTSDLVVEQTRRYGDLKSKRDGVWMDNWQNLSNYFLPELSDINVEKTEGTTDWTDRVFDITPILAAQALAMGQYNWLTPASQPWALFNPPAAWGMRPAGDDGSGNDGNDAAAIWLGKAGDILMQELAGCNFYGAVDVNYLSVSVFGTSLMFVEEGRNASLNFTAIKIGTYCIAEDEEGIVDTVYREFKMTTRQIRQKWGEDALTPLMKKSLSGAKGLDKEWSILHCCFPRLDSERVPGKKDGVNKPWASVYISLQDKAELSVGGYDEMPYICSRFKKWGTDSPWGYSPAFLTLPEARELNFVTMWMDALAELLANPRLLIPDNLDTAIDLRPGGPTYFDHKHPDAMPREWQTVAEYKMGQEIQKDKRDIIDKAFFTYVFQMLQKLQDKKMTAYEIAQRLGENLQQFTSIFDRRVIEFLKPLLRRTFNLLFRQGKFGPPPQSLLMSTGPQQTKGGRNTTPQIMVPPDIVITSRISLALKAIQNQGIESTLQTVMPLMENRPEVADNFDWDVLVRDLARNNGIPPDVIREKLSMARIRAERAKIQKQQQALQMAQAAAKAGQGLEKSPERLKNSTLDKMGVPEE